jgi:hypothetical protein
MIFQGKRGVAERSAGLESQSVPLFPSHHHHHYFPFLRAMASSRKRDKFKEWLSDFFSPKGEVRYTPDGKRFNGHT